MLCKPASGARNCWYRIHVSARCDHPIIVYGKTDETTCKALDHENDICEKNEFSREDRFKGVSTRLQAVETSSLMKTHQQDGRQFSCPTA